MSALANDEPATLFPLPAGYWWAGSTFALIEMAGYDAGDYLHRRTSQDIQNLEVGCHLGTALLDRKAEVHALMTVARVAQDRYYLLTESSQVESMLRELNRFKIMEQFTLEKATLDSLLVLSGKDWQTVWPELSTMLTGQINSILLPGSQQAVQVLGQPFFPFGQRGDAFGWLVLAPPEAAHTVTNWVTRQPFAQWDEMQQELARINAGLPRYLKDWTTDTTLPELALESLTVSYTKGCYLGQETVAKVKTYGGVNQQLVGIELKGLHLADITLPQPIHWQGKAVGQLTSASQHPIVSDCVIGLAFLNKAFRQAAEKGQALEIQLDAQVASLTIVPFSMTEASSRRSQAERLQRLGMEHFMADRGEEAIAILRQAVDLDPEYEAGWESLGVVLRRLDRLEDATTVFTELLARNPEAVMAYTNLSVLALAQGDKEQAETWKAQGTAVTMRVKMREAMAARQSASSTEGNSVDVAPPAESAITPEQRTRLLERIAMLEQALTFAPGDPMATFGIGSAWLELGDFQKAITALEQTLQAQPSHAKAKVLLSKARNPHP